MGPTEGNITNGIQCGCQIDHQLRYTCLEHKPTRHQLQKHPVHTECHKMSGVDHLYIEAKVLKVREHSELLSAHYLARCLEPGNVSNSITTRDTPKRRMKETLFTGHRRTVEPMMVANDRKATQRAIDTSAFNQDVSYEK